MEASGGACPNQVWLEFPALQEVCKDIRFPMIETLSSPIHIRDYLAHSVSASAGEMQIMDRSLIDIRSTAVATAVSEV